MKKDGRDHSDIEGLLEQAFPDDLPLEAELRMEKRLDRALQEWMKASRTYRPRNFALGRISLAAASALLVIVGLSFRLSRSTTPLASSLAILQKTVSVSSQVTNQRTMECTVILDKAEETSLRYVIRWVSPEETQVRLLLDGREVVHTIHPQRTDNSLLELITQAGDKKAPDKPPLKTELLPVEDLLTPSRLVRLLEGRWQPAGVERLDGCDLESYSISGASDAASPRVTVDSCTFLPVRLEKELGAGGKLEAVFRWSPRSGPGTVSRTIPS